MQKTNQEPITPDNRIKDTVQENMKENIRIYCRIKEYINIKRISRTQHGVMTIRGRPNGRGILE